MEVEVVICGTCGRSGSAIVGSLNGSSGRGNRSRGGDSGSVGCTIVVAGGSSGGICSGYWRE